MAETSSSLPAPTASRHNSSLLSIALDEIMSKIASSESQSVIMASAHITFQLNKDEIKGLIVAQQ